MSGIWKPATPVILAAGALALCLMMPAPTARADNKRLNDGVVANVYTVQHQAGCKNDVTINPQLQLAAQHHADDVLNNRNLDGDLGTDGSTPQQRASAVGYQGQVAETVAINQALAISGIELINQWYHNPPYLAIMSNCANTQIGVWSDNSPDRSVVVAVYGQPQQPSHHDETPPGTTTVASSPQPSQNIPIDPSPDYDASSELEFTTSWFAWILRGVYPPPANPPS